MATNGHDDGLVSWASLWEPKAEPRTNVVPLSPDVFLNMDGWLRSAIEGEMASVRDAEVGRRNHTLNTAAFNLGQIVGAGSADRGMIEQALRQAAFDAGLPEHEVDITLRSGLNAGIASPREIKPLVSSTVTEVSADVILAGLPAGADGAVEDPDAPRVPTSWSPQALRQSAALALGAPEPTHLLRDDGKALLYSGKINALIGESESGKSWIALLAAVQAVRNGEQVLLLDFEDSPLSVLNRVTSLGITASEDLDRIDYARPDEAMGVMQRDDLLAALRSLYSVIVVDGVNAAMVLLGLDLNSNTDATLFTTRLLKPLAATGACVITVDHVPKNPEMRGKGGIGAQAKRAMIDGCSLLVEVLEPFGKGQPGTLRLSVDKDRNGAVRGMSAGGRVPGTVRISSIMDAVTMVIEPPAAVAQEEAGEKKWRPTALMTRVSDTLTQHGDLSQNKILEATPGNERQLRVAIEQLVTEGFVSMKTGPRGAFIYHQVTPFIEHPDADLRHLRQPPPDLRQNLPSDLRQPPPTLSGGGGGQRWSGTSENEPTSAKVAKAGDQGLTCRTCGDGLDTETWDANDGYCADHAWMADR